MNNFSYALADSLAAARSAAASPGASLVVGGQSLIRDMKLGLVSPDALIDISRILGQDISIAQNRISIEAGCTHAQVASSTLLESHYPTLAALVGHIGDPAVRHRGTIGGALAAYEINGDYPPACLALNAVIRTTDREISADDFFNPDAHRTALTPGEIVLEISFDIPAKSAYSKILNPAARYAMVGVFVAQLQDGTIRIGVTGASANGAFRWVEAESALMRQVAYAGLEKVPLDLSVFAEDLFADGEFREHLVRVLTERTAARAHEKGTNVSVLSHGGRHSAFNYGIS